MSFVADTTTAEELRAIRKRLRLTQDEMAIRLGTTRGTYKNWEYGQSSPGESTMSAARALSSVVISIPEHEPNARVLPIRDATPVIQSLAEGQIALLPVWKAQGGIIGDEEFSFEEFEAEMLGVPAFLVMGAPIERFRAVVVSGFSMSPRIESGAIVVVRLADEAASGVITVVQADAGRLFVKTFRRDSYGNPELHSISDKFPPIDAVHLKGWRVRAVSCGIVHPYEPGRANIEWDAGRPLRA